MVKRTKTKLDTGPARSPARSAPGAGPNAGPGAGQGAGRRIRPEASATAKAIRCLLLAAYDAGKRNLPWRGESDPYRIWVSEVMLQQTRVATVLPYYRRWLERFPSLESLAKAREEEVLVAWQGLGYYSRARRLLGAARVVREKYGGELPSSAEELRRLPGVGEYTAGAVASMAFGEVVPAVDGNVKRVLARLFDLPDPGPAELRTLAKDLVDPRRPGDFNQAIMELGATVCLPRRPGCDSCTLEALCLARARGTVGERPARKVRRPVPEVEMAVVVAVWAPATPSASSARGVGEGVGPTGAGLRFLLRKRPSQGLLGGMWEFPGVEVGAGGAARDVALGLAKELGLEVVGEPIEQEMVTHLFSHLKMRYRPFVLLVGGIGGSGAGDWLRVEELTEVPLPVAQGRIAEAAKQVVQNRCWGL
jgi:A/G-specific adenine glycosylase